MTKQTDTSAEAVERLINDTVRSLYLTVQEKDLLRALAAERDEWKARASHTLADAYRAGLEAAADKAESMPTGIYPKDVAKAIRAQKVPTEFGGE